MDSFISAIAIIGAAVFVGGIFYLYQTLNRLAGGLAGDPVIDAGGGITSGGGGLDIMPDRFRVDIVETKPKKYEDEVETLRGSRNWMLFDEHGYTRGAIYVPSGIAYVWVNKAEHGRTEIEMVKGGKVYRRTWSRAYHRSYLPRLAKQFAEELEAIESRAYFASLDSIGDE